MPARLTHLNGEKLDRYDIANEDEAKAAVAQIERHDYKVNRSSENGQSPCGFAIHDVDHAAGSLAQTRLRGDPHHAHRAETVRGHRYWGRPG